MELDAEVASTAWIRLIAAGSGSSTGNFFRRSRSVPGMQGAMPATCNFNAS